MIRTGRVRSVDVLRSEGSGREAMAVDVPALRVACEDRRNHQDKQPKSPRPAEERLPAKGARDGARPTSAASPGNDAAPASPTPARERPAWLVMAVVAAAVAGLGIVGFLLTR
jgi:hypothetical protein